jgi:hypothetical protein
MRLILNNVRGAFLQVFQAKAFEGSEPAFSGAFIFPKNHPQVKELNQAIEKVGKEKFGAKWDAIYKAMKATDKTCLHDGDSKSQYDGFEGNLFVTARNKVRPTALNRDRSPVTEEDGVIYSGCYLNASLEIWAQDNKWGKRINATLRGVQYFGPGEAFSSGGAPATEDEFPDLSTDDTDPTA